MAIVKSYTDLEQSKKLAKILPIESADMRYEYPSIEKDEIQEPMIGFHTSSFNWFKESDSFIYFPCWSLAALLDILTEQDFIIKTIGNKFNIDIPIRHCKIWFPLLLDAAFEMICWLKENEKI